MQAQSSATPLSLPLRDPTTPDVRLSLTQNLWGYNPLTTTGAKDIRWESYFAHYTNQCIWASSNQGIHLAAETHNDIVRIADILHSGCDKNAARQSMGALLRPQTTPADEAIIVDGSIKLVTRLLTMINIGTFPSELTSQLCLDWSRGSLKACVHDFFNGASQTAFEDAALGSELMVRHMSRVAKIVVKPTDNLLDHLRVVGGGRAVCVFHHISFLRYMVDINCSTFPEGFIKETIETLILLFPDHKKKDKQWMKQYLRASSTSVPLDRGLLKTGYFGQKDSPRNLSHYRFWRDRLDILRETVERATPPTEAFKKALRNSKGDGWINSWIGVVAIGLTLFFGLVQSIEGAIQVYKAYH